jgi:outer membrane protein OmpA-like peptidoglycan-associated protein
MRKYLFCILLISIILTVNGCGKQKSMVVLIPDPDGTVGKLEVINEGGRQVIDQPNHAVQITDQKTRPGEVTTLSEKEIKATFEGALNAQPLTPKRFILYFISDSKELTKESAGLIPDIIETINSRSSKDIVISGHTDTVGEMDYNFRLSLDRAKAIYDVLVGSGVVAENITVTSHGEGNPLIKTGDSVSEPRNRRVEVVIK